MVPGSLFWRSGLSLLETFGCHPGLQCAHASRPRSMGGQNGDRHVILETMANMGTDTLLWGQTNYSSGRDMGIWR